MSKNRTTNVAQQFTDAEINQCLQRFYPNGDGRGYQHALLILNDLFAEDATESVTKDRLKACFLNGEPV